MREPSPIPGHTLVNFYAPGRNCDRLRIFGGDPQRRQNARMIKEIRALIKSKRYDSALKTGQEYLRQVPDNPDILFIMGGIYYMRRRYKTALTYFEKSLQIGRYDIEVLLLKAQCHRRLGQAREARACWQDVLEVDPKNREAKGMLG